MNNLYTCLTRLSVAIAIGTLTASSALAVPIQFKVNMSYKIDLEEFDPDMEYVDLTGTFNGWGNPPDMVYDPDHDEIYEASVEGFTPGTEIQFKFRINGEWNGREEFPGGGPNRIYLVQPDNNVIEVWYNDEIPSTGPPQAGFIADAQTVSENGVVHFLDRSAGEITDWDWIFEGGSPSTSAVEHPYVSYTQTGSYDVSLVVSNATESDTLVQSDFIHVTVRDTSQLSWWNDSVFYQVFVRSFFDSDGDGTGDFDGLTQKLDYLNDGDPQTDDDLGITGIWLMPINKSPSYHGYDATDYRSINPDFGTMQDFTDFLAAAHSRGIRVIMDYVMNHCSNQHPWFQASANNDPQYRDYYRWSSYHPGYNGPWGQDVWHSYDSDYYYGLFWSGMPDLNYETPAVKDSMFNIADFWLDTIGVDGFRLDAVLYIIEDGSALSNTEETYQFWQDFNASIKQLTPDAMTVGEAWTSTSTILNYSINDRLDYCFEFNLAYAILNSVNSEYAQDVVNKAQEVYNLYPHMQYGTFLTNHDQDRSMNTLGFNHDRVKVAASIYLTLPGIPYIYYGEEIGMDGSGAHEYIRRPMQWSNTTHAGFTSGSPWFAVDDDYPTYNVATELADPASILNWYKKLIGIRNQEATLRLGEYEGVGTSASQVMAFLRHYHNESTLVIINTGSGDVVDLTLSLVGGVLQPGDYKLNSLLDVDTLSVTVTPSYNIEDLAIDGYETLIYSLCETTGADIEIKQGLIDDLHLYQNFPNPFNPATIIWYEVPEYSHVDVRVYNLLGQEITTLIDDNRAAGRYRVKWDGRNSTGEQVASGVYVCSLYAGDLKRTTKMLLIK